MRSLQLHKSLFLQKTGSNSIYRSWWVFLFISVVYLFYVHATHKKQEVLTELKERLTLLEQEKMVALEMQRDLRLKIDSQNDPAFVQMLLMKNLGVVPEGQRKVYFQQEDTP